MASISNVNGGCGCYETDCQTGLSGPHLKWDYGNECSGGRLVPIREPTAPTGETRPPPRTLKPSREPPLGTSGQGTGSADWEGGALRQDPYQVHVPNTARGFAHRKANLGGNRNVLSPVPHPGHAGAATRRGSTGVGVPIAWEAMGPREGALARYTGAGSTGEVINEALIILVGALVVGTLAEIALALKRAAN